MRCSFLLIYAPTLYSAVFLLHAPAPAPTPIKIGFGMVRCSSCGCVGEAYTPTYCRVLRNLKLQVANANMQ